MNSMLEGKPFLMDEISLASDSVLERLNSLLEPERTLLLTDKPRAYCPNEQQNNITGQSAEREESLVVARKGFQLMATMNPGGDYGKKEVISFLDEGDFTDTLFIHVCVFLVSCQRRCGIGLRKFGANPLGIRETGFQLPTGRCLSMENHWNLAQFLMMEKGMVALPRTWSNLPLGSCANSAAN